MSGIDLAADTEMSSATGRRRIADQTGVSDVCATGFANAVIRCHRREMHWQSQWHTTRQFRIDGPLIRHIAWSVTDAGVSIGGWTVEDNLRPSAFVPGPRACRADQLVDTGSQTVSGVLDVGGQQFLRVVVCEPGDHFAVSRTGPPQSMAAAEMSGPWIMIGSADHVPPRRLS